MTTPKPQCFNCASRNWNLLFGQGFCKIAGMNALPLSRNTNFLLSIGLSFATSMSGCSLPSQPVSPEIKWEYQTKEVAPSAKDEILKKEGNQGWELVSSQESPNASDEQVEDLSTKINDAALNASKHFITAIEFSGNGHEAKDLIRPFANSTSLAGNDIPKLQENVELTLRAKKIIEQGYDKHLSAADRVVVGEEMRRAALATQEKMKLIKQYEEAKRVSCKLIFKKRKK